MGNRTERGGDGGGGGRGGAGRRSLERGFFQKEARVFGEGLRKWGGDVSGGGGELASVRWGLLRGRGIQFGWVGGSAGGIVRELYRVGVSVLIGD